MFDASYSVMRASTVPVVLLSVLLFLSPARPMGPGRIQRLGMKRILSLSTREAPLEHEPTPPRKETTAGRRRPRPFGDNPTMTAYEP